MANFSENLTIGWVFASATENMAISCFHQFFINFSSIFHQFYFHDPERLTAWVCFIIFEIIATTSTGNDRPFHMSFQFSMCFITSVPRHLTIARFYPAPSIVTSSVLSNITWMFQTSHVFLLVAAVHRISLNCINALYSIGANLILPVPNFINSLYSIDVNQILPVLLLACWAMCCYKHHYSRMKFGRGSFHLPTSPFSAHRVCPSTFIVEAWPIA